MKKQTQGSILLLIATFIWGTAFVAQSVGMDHIEPFTFQAVRSLIAVAALLPVIFIMERGKNRAVGFWKSWADPALWKTGIPCGVALFVASGLQQMGLVYTDSGKAGFITAMYIVLVPVIGLFLGQKCGFNVWISVILAVLGLYLLSALGVQSVNIGDLLLMGCAFAFAVQITLIDRLGLSLDGLRLNLAQFFVNAVLSTVVMFLFETPVMENIAACAGPLLYTGVLSSGVAYSLQILGQQRLDPAPASLIMSLESVFAVLAGWLILGDKLSGVELAGCALVFAGVILSQWEPKKQ
jgi:drug/metabolite transporter (DMT)-like permease